MISTLFNSSRQKNRLALDSSDGHTLSGGQHISVKLGDFWIPGIVESDGDYMLIPDTGGWSARIDLRPGMVVQTTDDTTSESEGKPVTQVNQNSNEALAALYGPAAAHAEYTRFTRVRYLDGGIEKQGLIIWITAADHSDPMLYVIEQEGFPEFVAGGDILGVVEEGK